MTIHAVPLVTKQAKEAAKVAIVPVLLLAASVPNAFRHRGGSLSDL